MATEEFEYAGFWVRVGASLIDTLVLLCVTMPLLWSIYGRAYFDAEQTGFIAGPADFLISWVLPAVAVITFWVFKQATPGKMLVSAKVVDAATGGPLTVSQAMIRYIGYFASTIPLFLGLIWVGIDPKKQGWHDKIAGTVVIRSRQRGPEPVKFDKE
jgi:uncharacterized RDD family membrane protein YckC